MRASRTKWTAIAFALATAVPVSLYAQTPAAQDPAAAAALRAEIDQLRQEFQAKLAALESRLAAMGGGQVTASQAPPAEPAPVSTDATAASAGAVDVPAVSGAGAAANAKIFNPDMAVIGNFLGAAGSGGANPQPALEMSESEVSLQAIVDPYARADFFLAFGEEGVDLEEGFLTFNTLPAGLLMKAGKIRSAFGKLNGLHTHAIPWADRPLVTENLAGGEEGISDAGVSVARLIPNPWLFLEATGQAFRGDSGDVFRSSRRGDLSYVGRLRAYQDISESTNLDLGVSLASGHNAAGVVNEIDVGRFRTRLLGVDATVRWRPLRRGIYQSFIGRSEVMWSRRDQPGGPQAASGFYVSGDYQLGRRWFTGLRIDRSNRADDASVHDFGRSLTLTFRPSEFSQIRGQARRTDYAEGVTANEVLLQLQFAIGAHGAHPF